MRYLYWWINNRAVLQALWKRDIENSHAGTILGFSWLVLNPMIYALTLFLAFKYGLRMGFEGEVSYGILLLSALCPWLLIASYLNSSANMLRQYSYLIKRTNVSIFVIPVVRLKTELLIHLILLIFIILAATIEGKPLEVKSLLVIYYTFCMSTFLLSLGLLFSSISLFIRDVGKFITTIVQIGFWATPVVWVTDIVPPRYKWLVELNPAEYIVSGYRCSIAGYCKESTAFEQDIYFWSVTIILFIAGSKVFSRLRPHFSEVV